LVYLITGGAGFVGSHLAERLLERGDEVLLMDNLSTGSMENIRHLKGEAKLEAIRKKMGGEFVYAGDSGADVVIWKAASAAVLTAVLRNSRRFICKRLACE